MGMFPENQTKEQAEEEEEIKTEEVKKVSEQTDNSRATGMANCLKDARKAYTDAGEQPSSEDLRAVAISFFIDEGKNGRVTQIRQDRGYTNVPATTNSYQTQGTKLPWFKFEEAVPVDITVISDDGEFQVNGRTTHGYTIESEGVGYKLTTMAKALAPRLVAGAVINVTMSKDGKYTQYEVK